MASIIIGLKAASPWPPPNLDLDRSTVSNMGASIWPIAIASNFCAACQIFGSSGASGSADGGGAIVRGVAAPNVAAPEAGVPEGAAPEVAALLGVALRIVAPRGAEPDIVEPGIVAPGIGGPEPKISISAPAGRLATRRQP